MKLLLCAALFLAQAGAAIAKQAPSPPSGIAGVSSVVFRVSHSNKASTVTDPQEIAVFVREANVLKQRPWQSAYMKHGCFVQLVFMQGNHAVSRLYIYNDQVYETAFGHPHPYVKVTQDDLQRVREKIRELGYSDPCKRNAA